MSAAPPTQNYDNTKSTKNTAVAATNDANTSVNLRTTRNTVGGPSAIKATKVSGPLAANKTIDDAIKQANVTTRNTRNNQDSDPNDTPTVSKTASKPKKEVKSTEGKGSNENEAISTQADIKKK